MPERFTGDGANVSPPLRWSSVPEGMRSLVLVVEDTDAPHGSFGHWAVFIIPPDVDELPEAADGKPDAGALRQGKNDFGNTYYDGPAPPAGDSAHEYHFRLAALDVPHLTLPGQIGKHLLEKTELVGIYGRYA